MDFSKLSDSQRQELEQLQKQFQEHQALQQQSSAAAVQQQPPAYDPFQVHQPYHPSQPYNQSYYYNYQDPSHPHQQQSHQQYDASYYHNYYSNSYQQQQHTHSETLPVTTYAAPNEQRNLGLGHVQDPYVNMGNQGNLGYPGPSGLNPTAAAAVAALSHLTQFAGSMAAAERHNQRHFRPPVGHSPYQGGGRRDGRPFRGGGHGNSGFRRPNAGVSGPPFRGRGQGRGRGRDRRGRRHGPPIGSPSSQPDSAQANAQPPVRIAWCEVCRVDCTHVEMLDQHNNGRRHKRNLRLLQQKKAADQPTEQPADEPTEQPADQLADQPADQPIVQTEEDTKPASDIVPEPHSNIPENNPDKQTKVGDDNNTVETKENDNQEKKPRMKRKMRDRVHGNRGSRGSRGGRGNRGGRDGAKRMRPMGPRKLKVVIPLVCDLCNIKCDTQEVFNRHAAGKRHMAKLRRFQGHQAMYGATAVQALYPPNPLSQTLAPQPAYYGEPSSYPAAHEAYVPPPYQAEIPNPQLADAPLEFATQTHASNGVQ
ncbi:hypothetical protein E3N88_25185 [Mikania micrantha]|uniref:U1-type domain-containing protein n=1 Tax=Mikania micrantha TaxID=192012 RepID=A0A5N6N4I2_9ASTR|nr:hypothetical protein E3N88_25185 [Mikania micrantha]